MKKGFTLIELLAVIVILAIIALIATPIVLNIINDTKESAQLRSAEMYLGALELSVAQATIKNKNISDGVYNITEGGNVCLEYNTDSVCTNKLEVETSGQAPKEGTTTITDGTISGLNIILNQKEIMKNSKNQMVYVKTIDEVCEHVGGTPKTAGAKYKCKVDPNKKTYTFYVLTTPSADDTSINLIMDTNINSDGTPVTKAITQAQKDSNGGIYNLVSWINKDDYGTLVSYDGSICYDESGCILNDKGPLTAMNFLQEVTKTWTNTNELIINTFTSCDDNEICEEKTMTEYASNARMPYYNEVHDSNGTNEYLYENLDGLEWYGVDGKQPTNNISGIYGYWTLSTYNPGDAWVVFLDGNISIHGGVNDNYIGVRPVITLKL